MEVGEVGFALTHDVIAAAMDVHSHLGAGLLESVYETCLAWELRERGFRVETQKALPLVYRGNTLDDVFRVDIVVEDSLIVELKNVQKLENIHSAQVLTYLNLSACSAALLINFNSVHLRDGIRRFDKRERKLRPSSPTSLLPSS